METGNVAIEDYLQRLDRASGTLPAGRRAELLAEIRAHIDEARRTGSLDGEADVRTLLERLGPPEDIVAAEAEGVVTPAGPPAARRDSTALEIWAVLMLTVGSVVVPIVGWLVGAVLLWSSRRWRTGEKLLGTLVVPGGLGALLILGLLGVGATTQECFTTSVPDGTGATTTTDTCTDGGSGLLHVAVSAGFLLAALASFIVPLYLLNVARKRATNPS